MWLYETSRSSFYVGIFYETFYESPPNVATPLHPNLPCVASIIKGSIDEIHRRAFDGIAIAPNRMEPRNLSGVAPACGDVLTNDKEEVREGSWRSGKTSMLGFDDQFKEGSLGENHVVFILRNISVQLLLSSVSAVNEEHGVRMGHPKLNVEKGGKPCGPAMEKSGKLKRTVSRFARCYSTASKGP